MACQLVLEPVFWAERLAYDTYLSCEVQLVDVLATVKKYSMPEKLTCSGPEPKSLLCGCPVSVGLATTFQDDKFRDSDKLQKLLVLKEGVNRSKAWSWISEKE